MKQASNDVTSAFVTLPPTRPDPTRPVHGYDSIHLQSRPGRLGGWMAAAAGDRR